MPVSARPGADQVARLDLGQRHARERRDDEGGDRDRQVAQAGVDRRVAEEALQVERQVEEQGEHRAGDRERRQLDAGEGAAAEQRERQHRLGNPLLDRHEGRQQHGGAGEERDDQRAAPALLVAAHQRQHQQEQGGGEGDQPAPVDPRCVGVAGLDQLPVGDADRRQPDRHVDQEDRLPPEAVGEEAADQRADRDGAADRGAVDAHRHPAFGAAGELLGDEREGDGEHDRAADALQATGEVEEGRVGGERAEQRGEGEDREADREDASAAQPVGQRAGGEDQGGEREGVGVDHPLQVGEAAAEVLAGSPAGPC